MRGRDRGKACGDLLTIEQSVHEIATLHREKDWMRGVGITKRRGRFVITLRVPIEMRGKEPQEALDYRAHGCNGHTVIIEYRDIAKAY